MDTKDPCQHRLTARRTIFATLLSPPGKRTHASRTTNSIKIAATNNTSFVSVVFTVWNQLLLELGSNRLKNPEETTFQDQLTCAGSPLRVARTMYAARTGCHFGDRPRDRQSAKRLTTN